MFRNYWFKQQQNSIKIMIINNNIMVVEPVMPTYLVSDCEVAKVVKFLFDPEQQLPIKYVIQFASGPCLIKEAKKETGPFSSLPLHADTVADYDVYVKFMVADFDREATLREFKTWGITKVYPYPFYDRIISMEDFLDGVLEHFVGNNKDYDAASSDEKEVIFK